MLTAVVVGFVYASINCFLFWRVQDIGGSEIQMGTAFCIGALSEFIFLLFGHRFIQKIGNGYTICIGVLCLSIRLLYFSFLWTPWALVGIEVLSGFSGAGIWMALLSYHDFNVNPRTARSVATALQALYYGLGYTAGAMISGYAYDTFGLPIVYQGACIIAFVWGLLFAILNKCLPKRTRVRYTKLLQDEDNLSDTSDGFEDDWLEMALKER
jgi:MFS family permease